MTFTTDDSKHPDTVLVVDDHHDNLALLRLILEKAGFCILTASSVAEARQILNQKKDGTDDPATPPAWSIDLVLSDISMPVESGFDLLLWMRQAENHTDHIPVLLITAVAPEDENRIKGLALGAVDYIVRPINNQELVLRVKNALQHFKQFYLLRQTLESSEDLAMTGRILAAANHEIKNLVTLIKISSDLAVQAAERGDPMNPGSPGFQSIAALAQTTKLLSIVSRDLNSHIGTESIYPQPFLVKDLIEDILLMTHQKIHGVMVTTKEISGDLWVLADATRAKQILINFVLNSCDAIAEKDPTRGGRIEFRVTERSKDWIQIRIQDNGIGTAQPGSVTDFEPFQTTKSTRGGKGLGLWLCARLAKGMGGRLELESDGPGLGATAILELQRARRPDFEDICIEEYLQPL